MKINLFIVLLFCHFIGLGQKRDQFEPLFENHYLGFHFDDDFLFLANRDEQYTGGLELEYIYRIKNTSKKINLLNPFPEGKRQFNATFGTYLFTPYNVSDSLIILNDRPFSSYIFCSIGYTAFEKQLRKKLSVELYLGFIGSGLPGKIQKKIHTVGESPPAYGWKNRIADSEYFLPNIRINYQTNLFTFGTVKTMFFDWLQIGSHYELNAGLYRNNISGGIKISAYSKSPPLRSLFEINKPIKKRTKTKFRFNFYFLPQIELVAYNTSLQSLPWLYSPYSISANEINRYVFILEGGFHLTYKRMFLNYIFKARTKEFEQFQPEWHSWAGVSMGFSW